MEPSTTPAGIDALLRERAWATRLARALVGDPGTADDLVQEAYVAALRRPPKTDRPLRGWLAGVIRNQARQHRRTEGRRARREHTVASKAGGAPPADELAARMEMQRRLAEAVLRLEEPYASVVMLRYLDGLSAAAIARRQGIPAATVRSQLKRGLERLRETLDDTHGGERRRWQMALMPVLAARPPSGGVLATLLGGALLMKTSTKLTVLAAVVLLGVGAWQLADMWGGADPATANPATEHAKAPAPSDDAGAPLLEGAATGPAADDTAAAAAPAPVPEPTPKPSPVAWIEGRCVDVSGNPLPNVTLREEFRPETETTTSGPDGRFSLAVPLQPTAMSQVHATYAAWARGYQNIRRDVVVSPGKRQEIGDVVFAAGGALRGRVVDEHGVGVPDARVVATGPALSARIRMHAHIFGPWKPDLPFAVKTDAQGRFELTGMPVTSLRVWAHCSKYQHAFSEPLTVASGTSTDVPDLVLKPMSGKDLIAGVVRNVDGTPAAHASIATRYKGADSSGTSGRTVDEAGRFAIPAKAGHDYWLRAISKDDSQHSKEIGPLRGGAEVELVFDKSATFAVRVTGADGEKVAYFQTRVLDPSKPDARPIGQVHQGAEAAVAIPEHDFVLEITTRGHLPARIGPVSVREDIAPIDVRLERRPALTGRVLAGEKPIAGAKVVLHPVVESNQFVVENGFPARIYRRSADRATTDADGNFRLYVETDGAYVLRAEHAGYAPAQTEPKRMSATEAHESVTLHLTAGGRIAGRVVGKRNGSVAGLVVGASRGDGHARSTRTAADGSYRFDHLRPGPWQVQILEHDISPGNRSMSSRDVSEQPPIPSNVHVEEGETATYDIDLGGRDRPARLVGTIRVNGQVPEGWDARGMTRRGAELVPASRTKESAVVVDGTFTVAFDEPGPASVRLGAATNAGMQILIVLDIERGETTWSLNVETGRLQGRLGADEPLAKGERMFLVHVVDEITTIVVPVAVDAEGAYDIAEAPVGPGRLSRFTRKELRGLGVEAIFNPRLWPVWKQVQVAK